MAATETINLAGLEALGSPPRGYEPLLKRYVVLLSSESKKCFDESRGPDGSPWAALKRPRDRQRDQKGKKAGGGSGQKPLRDTLLLMLSVTARGEGHKEEIGPTSLVWGSNLPYAGTHQEGRTVQVPEIARPRGTKALAWKDGAGKMVFRRHARAHSVTIPARPFVGMTDRLANQMASMAADYAVGELMKRSLRR